MAKAYSEDLRSRVVKNYLNGMSKIDVITYFEMGMDTLNHWIRQNLNVGNLKPKQKTLSRPKGYDIIPPVNFPVMEHWVLSDK